MNTQSSTAVKQFNLFKIHDCWESMKEYIETYQLNKLNRAVVLWNSVKEKEAFDGF